MGIPCKCETSNHQCWDRAHALACNNNSLQYQGRSEHFKEWGIQITKSCLVSDKYCSEVALKIDTVKDQGVRGGFQNPWNLPLATPLWGSRACTPTYWVVVFVMQVFCQLMQFLTDRSTNSRGWNCCSWNLWGSAACISMFSKQNWIEKKETHLNEVRCWLYRKQK